MSFLDKLEKEKRGCSPDWLKARMIVGMMGILSIFMVI